MKNVLEHLVNCYNASEWYQKILLIVVALAIIALVAMVIVTLIKELIWNIFKPDSKQEKIEKQKRAEKLKEIKARG